jgi:hypothetical protein
MTWFADAENAAAVLPSVANLVEDNPGEENEAAEDFWFYADFWPILVCNTTTFKFYYLLREIKYFKSINQLNQFSM